MALSSPIRRRPRSRGRIHSSPAGSPPREQVDLKRRVIRLTETKNGSARTVPLTKRALTVMRAAMKNPVRPDETNLVFFGEPGRDGQRRGYDFKPAWFGAVKAAGLKNFRFHDLRHEAVSRLVEAGLSDQEAASISGRSDFGTADPLVIRSGHGFMASEVAAVFSTCKTAR